MTAGNTVTRAQLKTPSAAAIAGLLFSCLLIIAFWLLRISIPADPQEPGSWLHASSGDVAIALNLVPFAGISFLWFIGVLRDRLGQLEDRFFTTVFFGSGLLFLAMLFLAAGVAGGLLIAFAAKPDELIGSATFHFARAAVYVTVNVYLVKMAGVFMITTSTIALYTGIAPRWLACPQSNHHTGPTSPLIFVKSTTSNPRNPAQSTHLLRRSECTAKGLLPAWCVDDDGPVTHRFIRDPTKRSLASQYQISGPTALIRSLRPPSPAACSER